MHPDLGKTLLDALQQALKPFDLEIRMQAALHENAGATHGDCFCDFVVDGFEVEDVAFGSLLAFEWTIEGTEGAVLGAEVGVVDVAIDDVGHNAFGMQLSAHGIGFHAETDEVVRVEVIEGLLACDRHTSILCVLRASRHIAFYEAIGETGAAYRVIMLMSAELGTCCLVLLLHQRDCKFGQKVQIYVSLV